MAEVEYADYVLRKGARLAYNDGTGPKVARDGETVTLPTHLAEGEFAARLNHADGRAVERSRWSMADIHSAPAAERASIIEQRKQQLAKEQVELASLESASQAEVTAQETSKRNRREQLSGGEQ